ncbi:glycosyltransferase family 1 protein [Microbulbifer elongatus]|uniref:Glycosyltransferase family 1 protein n=1 Tax=Microbulbifer elongatus TaxID=86173 RepID=A0ABT1NYF3_9GAMM|nr:glycosyltransferase [Microbulbifer elongatus]MCQ3828846.1 glycosyltransferase family 1 protein [Microbulbifer elongatus]
MRILHIDHHQYRKYGHLRVSWARKLYTGLIRAGHNVLAFSDRDVAKFEAPLGIRDLGRKRTNKRLLQTVDAFQPELIIFGHCDLIDNATFTEIRRRHPDVILAGCNNDPLFVPRNAANIKSRCIIADAMFVSTGPRELASFTGNRAKLWHMPNPVDPSEETADASNLEGTDPALHTDLLFCSKSESYTERGKLISKVKAALPTNFRFHTPGMFDQPTLWGRDYERKLAASKMGLNLNRQEGYQWYSSARIAQMAGNGLLIFTNEAAAFDDFMPSETLAYFDDEGALLNSIRKFHHDDAMRRHWAGRCREFFHREINNTLYAQYIVEAATETQFSHDYVWVQ